MFAYLVRRVLGMFLLLFRSLIGDAAFRLLHGSTDVEAEAAAYYAIRVWGAPSPCS